MASIPVRAVHPPANARSSSQIYANPARSFSASMVPCRSGSGATPSNSSLRRIPIKMTSSTPPTKAYVGMAKTVALSRAPRRFIQVMNPIAPSAMITR